MSSSIIRRNYCCEGDIETRRKNISAFVMFVLIGLFGLGLTVPQKAQADGEPVIVGGSTTSGLVDNYIPITGLEITGDSVDPIPVTITVVGGQLSMTTTTGLTFSRGPVGSKLAFTGSKTDINAALATLQFRTTRAGSFNISVELTNPGLVYYPGNGHLYEVVSGDSISWNDAKIAAEARTVNGAQGYLATVTSQAENDYISARLENSGWMGASDAGTEGDWQWVTGPEVGTSFWLGLGDGVPVNGGFSAWADGEPNDSGGEDCAQYYPEGSWNDLPCDGPFLNRYVVEYGAYGDLPIAPSTTSVTVNTTLPVPEDIAVSSCLDLINAASTNQNDNRYDTLTLTQDIDCTGETIRPLFNDYITTEDDEEGTIRENLGFRGVFDGNGHVVRNLTIESEMANEGDEPRTGFFAASDGATIRDVTFESGTVAGVGGYNSHCTGGVVGEASNTAFENVSVGLDVSGGAGYPSSVGGIVGCLESINGDSSIVDSESTGTVAGYNYVGGLVGNIETQSDGDVVLENNTATANIQANDSGSNFGGLVGKIEAYDVGDSILITHNSSSGLVTEAYYVGGLVGYISTYDGAVVTVGTNTVSGDVLGIGNVGGVVGYAYVTDESKLYISDIDLQVNILAISNYAGGVASELYASGETSETKIILEDVTYSGDVSANDTVGGITGSLCADYGDEEVVVRNVITAGTVTATDSGDAGGIAGRTCGGLIENVSSTSSVEANSNAGGLTGSNYDARIYRSYATGSVTAIVGPAGGIASRNADDGLIEESFSTGNVSGVERVGGVAGANGARILNSYARGTVAGETQVGGIAGRCGGEIEKSYATGPITGDTNVGGVVGSDQGCDVVDTFWDAEASGQGTTQATAVGKTTAEMKSSLTYTSTDSDGLSEAWDFSTIWNQLPDANDGYPCLQWYEGCASVLPEDLNGDGTLDALQPNVGGYVSPITGKIVAMDMGEGCELTIDDILRESNLEVQDPAYEYSEGLFDFEADCGTPGYTTTIKLYYYDVNPTGRVLRKYNPLTNMYFNIADAQITQQTINSQNVAVVTYSITDGGVYDTDSEVNGYIRDPAGLAELVLGVPNTGLGGNR